MNCFRLTSLKKSLNSCSQTATRGKHRIDKQQSFTFYAWCSYILCMNTHFCMFAIQIHAESRNKSIVSTVKYIEKALMER